MGGVESKQAFRGTVLQLTGKTVTVASSEESFWDQIFQTSGLTGPQDAFTLITSQEIRTLRDEAPSNLATLCYKAVEHLVRSAAGGCPRNKHNLVLNCVRLLTRILPYIFEDQEWRGFFWSALPGQSEGSSTAPDAPPPLAQSLIGAVLDLLFCPDFTVIAVKKAGPRPGMCGRDTFDSPEDLSNVDSCEYIWEAGVGFALSPGTTGYLDGHRAELLRLLLTCFSETMYKSATSDVETTSNQWLNYFCSSHNRHALPLFTSLLNTVCAYDPVGLGVPYYHAMVQDKHEPLVEIASQLLCVILDAEVMPRAASLAVESEEGQPENLFCNYMSRIHRDEDFAFILRGISRLLNNPLLQTYLPGSCKKVAMHQELLILFWKMCDLNKKFLYFVLKSSDVLDMLVPILYHLNDSRSDASRVGLMHICVFILLLLSGERNFGVRLNKPYQVRVPMDIPVFTGNHGDLLVLVFHKVITTGHQRLTPLFDCLLTIVVNVSPYLKSLSMVSSAKLGHLMEAFSTPWYLFANATNHHLIFFLLEIFNNIIQYQFDGNSNLIYQIIRRRDVFHKLANLPTDPSAVRALPRRKPPAHATKSSSAATSAGSGKEAAATAGGSSSSDTAVASTSRTPSDDTVPAQLSAAAAEGSQSASSGPATSGQASDSSASATASAAATGSMRVEQAAAAVPTPSTAVTTGTTQQTTTSSTTEEEQDGGAQGDASDEGEIVPHSGSSDFVATQDWIESWKEKLPLQTVLRLLQVLVPQVEKICIDKGLTDEMEILKFLQHGTLVGLLPVPHPILIRKYQANSGTNQWFRTYMWGVLYLRNMMPPVWYDTEVKLFEVQRV
ncbi:protein HID1-like [Sycon ciliatum]|uniref:protein HID1-like n=1 Tax=Sycon ciliatum TaxID=27933 RepID=UPI0031F60F33